MSSLLIGVLGALVASNPPAALSNAVTQSTGIVVTVPSTNDRVEQEFRSIMERDDAAEAEIDGWIQENDKFKAGDAGIPDRELNERIHNRLEPIRQDYEKFLKEHPNHTRARVALASLLADMNDEHGELDQLKRARELDPANPAVWNNMGNWYGHNGEVTNAFVCYQKAIELNPKESVYFENLATTVFVFRKDSREFFHLNEQQVYDKAMLLYSNALYLNPTNFPLATDMAQNYYVIKPMRTNDALAAWTNALHLAHDEIEREGVYVHLARLKMSFGQLAQAHALLNTVTNPMYGELKKRLAHNLQLREEQLTNSPPPATNAPAPNSKSETKSQNAE